MTTNFPPIVPHPAGLERLEGPSRAEALRAFAPRGDKAREVAHTLCEQFYRLLGPREGRPWGVIEAADGDPAEGRIVLELDESGSIAAEGYRLELADGAARIVGADAAGLFYGAQTLLGLLMDLHCRRAFRAGDDPREPVPAVRIQDAPRYRWRGMHLDVARHFFPVSYLRRYIDILALHKINVFHLHLTEDQGWRFESARWPLLSAISAWRQDTPRPRWDRPPAGEPHGGYYTQNELRDLVAYARRRFVTIVPELDLPGHSQSVLAAYPHLGCTGGPYEVRQEWGISPEILCAGSDEAVGFAEDILAEMLEVFDAPYIHLGGDEVPPDRWLACPRCRRRMEVEGLETTGELQGWFMNRVGDGARAAGRRLIGWDEILEAGGFDDAIVMAWRETDYAHQAVRQGRDLIATVRHWTYLNYTPQTRVVGPGVNRGDLPMEKALSYEPAEGMTGEQAARILGVQGCLWTEYIPTSEDVESLLLPRLGAIAEAAWTPRERRDADRFLATLKKYCRRMIDLRAALGAM
jgi:hexosaminidase